MAPAEGGGSTAPCASQALWQWGITDPSILGYGAIVGATTVACALLLDVVVTAEGGAFRIVPGPVLGPGVLAFAFVITLLAGVSFPFPFCFRKGWKTGKGADQGCLPFQEFLPGSLANCLPLSPLSPLEGPLGPFSPGRGTRS